jgi:hypothetical protein
MDNSGEVWLAADYHFPGTYSCRVPMSSMNSALALPAPGPATVRLALVKVGIELYGLPYTRDVLFPILRAASVYIRPPEQVAISQQQVRLYKADAPSTKTPLRIGEVISYREYAHAHGLLTIYMRVPTNVAEGCRSLLRAVGYWGQTSSLAYCVSVRQEKPCPEECIMPIRSLNSAERVGRRFSCMMTEFRHAHIEWDEIDPDLPATRASRGPFTVDVCICPMSVVVYYGGKLLTRIVRDGNTLQRN